MKRVSPLLPFTSSRCARLVQCALTAVAVSHSAGTRAADAAAPALPEVQVRAQSDVRYNTPEASPATRSTTPLRDTPQSITVIPREAIEDQDMRSVADALRYTPGVVTAQGEGNRDTAVFRGNSTTGDFFVDGVRDDVQYYRDFYNIESIETLKGPNALLFGRGGAGGILNRVSKQPEWKQRRDLTLTLGSFDSRRVAADVGQALNSQVALRLNAMYENSGSYRDSVDLERAGINPSLSFKAGDNTLLTVSYEHFRDDRTADRGIPSRSGRPYDTDDSTFFGNADDSYTWSRVNAWSASLEHDFGSGTLLRNRTRYAMYDKFYQNVFPNGAVSDSGTVELSAYNNATQRDNFFNQTDLLFTVTTGPIRHQIVTGLEVGRQTTDNIRLTGYFTDVTPDTTKVAVPVDYPSYPGTIEFRPSATDANNHGVADIRSLYIQDEMDLGHGWTTVLGLRYDSFAIDFMNNRTGTPLEKQDEAISPRFGLVYKPTEAVSLWGSYSVTYVPRAGDQLSSLTPTNSVFDPEEMRNTEVGIKWDIRRGLSSSLAIYQLDRNGVAITDPANTSQQILVDGQRTKGLELSINGNVTRDWAIMGGYAWQDAEYLETQSATIVAGATVAQVPRHTFSLWNRYQVNEQWAAALGVIYRDRLFASNDNTVELPEYARFDAAVYYTVTPKARVQLNVENLLNQEYYAAAHTNNNITPGAPLSARLTLNLSF